MARFGGTAVVRDRATSVIVKFVPVATPALMLLPRTEGLNATPDSMMDH